MDDLGKGEPHWLQLQTLPSQFSAECLLWSQWTNSALQKCYHWTNRCIFSGAALSSCAHVKELIRTKQGQFTLEEHALREEQWTLEHIVRSMQPCEPSSSGTRSNLTKTDKKNNTLGTRAKVESGLNHDEAWLLPPQSLILIMMFESWFSFNLIALPPFCFLYSLQLPVREKN